MALSGETTGGKQTTICDCGQVLTLRCCESRAGHYLGYRCSKCGPAGRETEYYRTLRDLAKAVTDNTIIWR